MKFFLRRKFAALNNKKKYISNLNNIQQFDCHYSVIKMYQHEEIMTVGF